MTGSKSLQREEVASYVSKTNSQVGAIQTDEPLQKQTPAPLGSSKLRRQVWLSQHQHIGLFKSEYSGIWEADPLDQKAGRWAAGRQEEKENVTKISVIQGLKVPSEK